MSESLNGLQALAWIMWRSQKAVERFSGDDACDLWGAALRGEYPADLPRPDIDAREADRQLRCAIRTGIVDASWVN